MTTGELASQTDVEARLARIEATLERLAAVLDAGPPWFAMATDAVDEAAARAADRGVDVDARLQAVVAALEAVSEPRTLAALVQIVGRAEKLQSAVGLLAQFDDIAGMTLDVVDESARNAAAQGIDVDARARRLATLLAALTEPTTMRRLERLVTKLPLLDDALERVVQAVRPAAASRALDLLEATSTALQGAPRPVGLVGVVRALSEKPVRRAAGAVLARPTPRESNL